MCPPCLLADIDNLSGSSFRDKEREMSTGDCLPVLDTAFPYVFGDDSSVLNCLSSTEDLTEEPA